MAELHFEWDGAKATANQNKHGVSFEEAKTVFADELARLIPDPDHSTGEERFILLGMSRNFRLLVVSHCERSSDRIRIISARKANRQERGEYEGFINA
ncbi:MAG: BrnT family toxin [Nitrosospira sp.]|nr:BrnT family toxin [Nitrosospira sp.]